MAYATSTSAYEGIYAQFRHDAPNEVVKYMDENWNPIRDEWVFGLKASCGSYLNFTNNRLECIDGKLKQVISRNSSLEEFIHHFFVILSTLRTERDHKAALVFQKVNVDTFEEDSPESLYSRLLTSYASSFLFKQMKLACKVKEFREDGNGKYNVESMEGIITLDSFNCSCIFSLSMKLPCWHIFALRTKLSQPLYEPSLCEERWTADYYKSTQRLFSSSGSRNSTLSAAVEKQPPMNKLSQHQKFRKAAVLTSTLATVMSEACGIHFTRRMEQLQELIDCWKNGKEVILMDASDAGVLVATAVLFICIHHLLLCS